MEGSAPELRIVPEPEPQAAEQPEQNVEQAEGEQNLSPEARAEKSKAAEIERAVHEQAMRESQTYFETRRSTTEQLLRFRKDHMLVLLNHVKQRGQFGEPEVLLALGYNEEDQDIDVVRAVMKSLQECIPVGDLEMTNEHLDDLILEQLDPVRDLQQAEKSFAQGQSWYHTDPEGKVRLTEIQQSIEASYQAVA